MKDQIKTYLETFFIAFLMGAGFIAGVLVVSKIATLF